MSVREVTFEELLAILRTPSGSGRAANQIKVSAKSKNGESTYAGLEYEGPKRTLASIKIKNPR